MLSPTVQNYSELKQVYQTYSAEDKCLFRPQLIELILKKDPALKIVYSENDDEENHDEFIMNSITFLENRELYLNVSENNYHDIFFMIKYNVQSKESVFELWRIFCEGVDEAVNDLLTHNGFQTLARTLQLKAGIEELGATQLFLADKQESIKMGKKINSDEITIFTYENIDKIFCSAIKRNATHLVETHQQISDFEIMLNIKAGLHILIDHFINKLTSLSGTKIKDIENHIENAYKKYVNKKTDEKSANFLDPESCFSEKKLEKNPFILFTSLENKESPKPAQSWFDWLPDCCSFSRAPS